MTANVQANTHTRTIELLDAPVSGFVELDVRRDIYSNLKSQWQANTELQKLKFPLRSFGDSTGAAQIGPYIFIDNISGWRVLPYPGDHELQFVGNLIPESAVAGETIALWLSQPGFTVLIRQRESAQALTVTTSGADANGVADAVWSSATTPMTSGTVGEHIVNKLLTKGQFLGLKD